MTVKGIIYLYVFSVRLNSKMESTRLEGGMTKNNLESRIFSMSLRVVCTLKFEEKKNVGVWECVDRKELKLIKTSS